MRWAGSQVGSDHDVKFDAAGIVVVQRDAEVDADHADRRAPARADAGADLLPVVVEPGERVTGVDEGGDAPVGLEVVLVFRARDGEELAAHNLPMQRAARTGETVWGEVVEVVRHDGESRWLYEYAIPLFDSAHKVRGCLGAFVDITERKRVEQTLARNATEQGALYAFAERLHRAAKQAPRVAVYVHKDHRRWLPDLAKASIHRADGLALHAFDIPLIRALASRLDRRMSFALTVADAELFVAFADGTLSGRMTRLEL